MQSHAVYLLVPILLPVLGALAPLAAPIRAEALLRRRWLGGVLVLEILFSLLSAHLHGVFVFARLGGAEFSLARDSLGALFSAVFSGVFCLAGIFGFECRGARGETRFYLYFLLLLAALQGLAAAASGASLVLFFLLTLGFSAALLHRSADPAKQKAALPALLGLGAGALALGGMLALGALGGSLAFLPGGIPSLAGVFASAGGFWAALALLLGFGAAAGLLPFFWYGQAAPQTGAAAVWYGGLTGAGLLGILRCTGWLLGAGTLRGSRVQTVVLALALLTVLCSGIAALREPMLARRLSWVACGQGAAAVFGAAMAARGAFAGTILTLLFGGLAEALVFLGADAFRAKAGKAAVRQLDGIGRQMPLTLFCFAMGALVLAGLPPLGGFSALWLLAGGALGGSALEQAGAGVLLAGALCRAGALIPPVARGFFPGAAYEPDTRVHRGWCLAVPLVLLTGGLLVCGLFPAWPLRLAQEAAAAIF